jgi:hypothetical protein
MYGVCMSGEAILAGTAACHNAPCGQVGAGARTAVGSGSHEPGLDLRAEVTRSVADARRDLPQAHDVGSDQPSVVGAQEGDHLRHLLGTGNVE